MSDEPKTLDSIKNDLLEAISSAIKFGQGANAREFAQAYYTLTESKGVEAKTRLTERELSSQTV
jgi:hypothetical protein